MRLTSERSSGTSVFRGIISNLQYISPVTGSYHSNAQKLTLKFDDSTDPSEYFHLSEGRRDRRVTSYDNEGLDFIKIAPGEVPVETFENIV